MIGEKFGRWTIISESLKKLRGNKYWVCECDCGVVREVIQPSLKSGRSKSCGCLQREKAKAQFTKHNLYNHRIYNIWRAMNNRCNNEKHDNFHNYGDRGIRVCDEWKDVQVFYNWALNNGYENDLTIERINNDGNYEPDNCTWATMKQQQNHRRNTVLVEFNGEIKPFTLLCDEHNIKTQVVRARLRSGWKFEDALTREVKKVAKK